MLRLGIAEWAARTANYAAGLIAPALLALAGSSATAVTIAPIMVELSAHKKVASVRVLNDSAEAMTLQAGALSWEQLDGEDKYTPTQQLLVAPAIALIAPGGSQIFRVTLRTPTTVGAERAYRLLLEDVSAETNPRPGVVNLRFLHNLPLFVSPHSQLVLNSQWSRCAAPANKVCVRLDNLGNRRVRLSAVTVEGQGWHKAIVGAGATVLAGASRQWLFDLKGSQRAGLRIIATSDVGESLKVVELR